jgi:hypothetical protein
VTSGSPPAGVCPGQGINGSDWYLRQTPRMGDTWTATCKIHTPWHTPDNDIRFRLDGAGAITAVGVIDADAVMYASSEVDPDLQNMTNLLLLPVPNIATFSGTVSFNQPGSTLRVHWYYHDADTGFLVASGAFCVIHAEPGLHIIPVGGDERDVGIALATDFQSAIILGDAPPNTSINGSNRNNGGYIEGGPAPLNTPIDFTVFVDETHKDGWGRIEVSSDIGSGHLEHLDYLNPSNPFPGEPALPVNECADEHLDHVVAITLHAGAAGTYEEPAVILENVVIGHSTCVVNPDYVSPGTEE